MTDVQAVALVLATTWACVATVLWLSWRWSAHRQRADHAARWQRVIDRVFEARGGAPLPARRPGPSIDAASIQRCLRSAVDDDDLFAAMVACLLVGAYDVVHDLGVRGG